MAIGLGRIRRNIAQEVSGEDESGFNGFGSNIVKAQFSKFTSDYTVQAGEWQELAYYTVSPQEEVMLGAKDSASNETGKIVGELRDTGNNVLNDVLVRFGYRTRAGRSTDIIFEEPVSRLYQTDHEDLRGLAPKPWGSGGAKPPTGRGKPARAMENDRVFVSVYSESEVIVDYDNTDLRVPATFNQE